MTDKLVELGPSMISEKALNEKGYYLRESEQGGRFKPEDGETYWYFYSGGELDRTNWAGTYNDNHRRALGNCYRTKEEAITARDKQLALVRVQDKLEELTDEPLEWGANTQTKHGLLFKHSAGEFWATIDTTKQALGLYGSSDAVDYVIDNMESDLKLIVGIA